MTKNRQSPTARRRNRGQFLQAAIAVLGINTYWLVCDLHHSLKFKHMLQCKYSVMIWAVLTESHREGCVMSKYFILAAVLAMFGFTSQTWAEDDNCPKGNIQGEWLAGEIVPNPIPSFCSRMYACVSYNEAHNQPTMSDPDCKRIYTNPPAQRKVNGACSAAGGAADSCNECLAGPPDDACEYHYVHD